MRVGLVAVSCAGLVAASYSLFDNLIVFGDSYSDNGRLSYYINHDGTGPPAGVLQNQSSVTASGGLTWNQYVQKFTPGLALFDYAVSGAVCSNELTSRYFSAIKRSFPSVIDDEIPSFQADIMGAHTLYTNRTADNTVYALWIGTNDLGYGAFLSDSQASGTNITSFVDCVWQVLDAIYAAGGRRIVLLNQAPLQLAPMYRPQSDGGAGNNQYWGNKTAYNETEYAQKMLEYTINVNTMFDYGVPFFSLVKRRWLGASVSIFNTHKLLTDIYYNPSKYLTAPANSTGYYHHCVPTNNSDCADAAGSLDNYLFFDELHPSAKTDSIIAEHFLDVVAGISKYGMTYSS